MDDDTETIDEAADESRIDDNLDRVIKVLYVLLVTGNLALLAWEYRDSPQGLIVRARARRLWFRLNNCEGCARRKEALRRATGRMLWEAQTVVEGAAEAAQDGGEPA